MSNAAANSHGGHHEEHAVTGVPSYKLAMWTFLGSECFFFGSLIGTYMSLRGHGKVIPGYEDSPLPFEVFSPEVTSISTFVLLLSSLFMALAVMYAKSNDLKNMTTWTVLTILGGLFFLGCQVYEFNHFVHEGLTLKSSTFGSTFYVLTGFHGTHVAVGVLLLGSLLWAARGGHLADLGLSTEIIGLYWHFVDIVWIAIFTLVYLLEFA